MEAAATGEKLDHIGPPRGRRAKHDVGVAGEQLGGAVHDHVGAGIKWALKQRCGEGVVNGDIDTKPVGAGDEGCQVGYREKWVGRGFQPEQPASAELAVFARRPGRSVNHLGAGRQGGGGVRDINGPEAQTSPPGDVAKEPPGAVVGISGDDDPARHGQELHDGRDGCQARGEDQRRSAFQGAEDFLECLPGRIPVPPINEVTVLMEGGTEHHRWVDRTTGISGGPTQVDDLAGRGQAAGRRLVQKAASRISSRSARMAATSKRMTAGRNPRAQPRSRSHRAARRRILACLVTPTASAGSPKATPERFLTSQKTSTRPRVITRSSSPSRHRQLRSRIR